MNAELSVTEHPHPINGCPGRLTAQSPMPGSAGLWLSQRWVSEPRNLPGGMPGERIKATIRFDDDCHNGHNSFAITGESWTVEKGRNVGCCHEAIALAFPELAHLIKWHLSSTDGPMHYVANTVHLAGDRDCWGLLKGEPRSFDDAVTFERNPIKYILKKSFRDFLGAARPQDLQVVAVPHKDDDKPRAYKYGPKFTFKGHTSEWYKCPFESEADAEDFRVAMVEHFPKFVRIPTSWSEGKARELDAARNAAVWPEATDEELSVPKEELKAALIARLPGLLADMRRDVEAAGLRWSS